MYVNWDSKTLSEICRKIEHDGNFAVEEKIPTGFPCLDGILDGGISKGLYCIGAVPGLGKSTFLTQVAENISMSGVPVLLFSLEMDILHLAVKSISRNSYLAHETDKNTELSSTSQIMSGKIPDAAVKTSKKNTKKLHIIEDARTFEKIREYVVSCCDYQKVKPVVMIDYLQIMQMSDGSGMTDKQMVDYNVSRIKQMSEELKVPVIIISAFNRDSYELDASLRSFKDSGSIEYSCDTVIGLKEFSPDGNKKKSDRCKFVKLTVLKQKYGKTGTVTYRFYPSYSCFVEDGSKKESTF